MRSYVRERHAFAEKPLLEDQNVLKQRRSKYFVDKHGASVLKPWLGIPKNGLETFRMGYNPLGFLLSTPVTKYHCFPRHLWQTWVRFTLGLPLQDSGLVLHKTQCVSCHSLYGRFGHHALTCKHAIMRDDNANHQEHFTVAWDRAHNNVVDALGWCLLDTMCNFSTKPSGIPKHDPKKSKSDRIKENSLGDVFIQEKFGAFNGLVADFNMCHPRFGSSQVRGEGEWRCNAMQTAIKAKNDKHLSEYNKQNRAFVALVADTYGVLSDDLVRFLWLIAHKAAEKSEQELGPVPGVDSDKGFVRRRSAKYARICAYIGVAVAKSVVARIIHNSTTDDLDKPFMWDSSYRNSGRFDVDGDIPVQHIIYD